MRNTVQILVVFRVCRVLERGDKINILVKQSIVNKPPDSEKVVAQIGLGCAAIWCTLPHQWMIIRYNIH